MTTYLITGASGFLGRYVVGDARRNGHKVRALVRRKESIPEAWQGDAGITPVVLDMAVQNADFTTALSGVDAVIHLAASLTGNNAGHARDTVLATQQLYDAVGAHPIPIILASSIGVYEGRAGDIDEDSIIERHPESRDAYLRAKLEQENLAMQAVAQGVSTHILRLGAIYGPDRIWNAHIGVRAGPVLILLAGDGEIPLCFAPHAARALTHAAGYPLSKASIEVLNIVDDDLPDARHFLKGLGREYRPAFTLPFPWQILMIFARASSWLRLPVPGLLRPATLAARMAPRTFSNIRAKAALGWAPNTGLETALTTLTTATNGGHS